MHQSVKRAAAILRGELQSTWTLEKTADEHLLLAKLTGQLKYTDDLTFPGMLVGAALRRSITSCPSFKVDTTDAEKMPGVVRVLTAKDVPGKNRLVCLFETNPFL